jgi:hypothetical protein
MRAATPLLAVTLAVGCRGPAAAPGPSPATLTAAESLYLDTRDLRDRIDVLDASGRPPPRTGLPASGWFTARLAARAPRDSARGRRLDHHECPAMPGHSA